MNSKFFIGLLVGFAASVSFGPVALSIVQKTLTKGRKKGIIAGLGAATTDTLFAIFAFYGGKLISGVFEPYSILVRIIGGMIVISAGLIIFFKKTIKYDNRSFIHERKFGLDYFSTLLLAFSNPFTFIIYSLIFNLMFVKHTVISHIQSYALFAGIFCGSILWWCLITTTSHIIQSKINLNYNFWLNRFIGSSIIIFGSMSIIRIYSKIPDINTLFENLIYLKFLSTTFFSS